jgi:hypothetical protein
MINWIAKISTKYKILKHHTLLKVLKYHIIFMPAWQIRRTQYKLITRLTTFTIKCQHHTTHAWERINSLIWTTCYILLGFLSGSRYVARVTLHCWLSPILWCLMVSFFFTIMILFASVGYIHIIILCKHIILSVEWDSKIIDRMPMFDAYLYLSTIICQKSTLSTARRPRLFRQNNRLSGVQLENNRVMLPKFRTSTWLVINTGDVGHS